MAYVSKKSPRVILTPIDVLRGKEKLEYKKTGKVVKYNMYDVNSYEEFKALDNDAKVTALKYWAETKKMTRKEMAEKLGSSKSTMSDWFYRLGLSKKINTPKRKAQKKTEELEVVKETDKNRLKGTTITMRGNYTGSDIADKFLRLSEMLYYATEYDIEVSIIERGKEG